MVVCTCISHCSVLFVFCHDWWLTLALLDWDMAAIYAILTFASDTIRKKSLWQKFRLVLLKQLWAFYRKNFFGETFTFPLLRVKEFKRKRLPPPSAQWFRNLRPDFFYLRKEEGYGTPRRLRKQSTTCKYMSIPKVWLLDIGLISIRWCCSCSEEIDRSTSGTSTAPVSDESLPHAWLGKGPSWSMP